MNLIFLRHGETIWNRTGRWQGNTDVPLSETGMDQARKASEQLKNYKIDCIFSSDLRRARDTARIVSEALGMWQVMEDRRLRERNLGIMEGKTTEEIKKMLNMDVGIVDIVGKDLPVEGLESIESQFLRGREILNSINGKWENVLIVSHGVMIGILLNIITGEDFRYRKISNCEIIRVENADMEINKKI